jgi:hypothetical protein
MVAAGCMVLYGYDAAVFNAVQKNAHWLDHFNKPVSRHETFCTRLILTFDTARKCVGVDQYVLLNRCYCFWMVYWRSYSRLSGPTLGNGNWLRRHGYRYSHSDLRTKTPGWCIHPRSCDYRTWTRNGS